MNFRKTVGNNIFFTRSMNYVVLVRRQILFSPENLFIFYFTRMFYIIDKLDRFLVGDKIEVSSDEIMSPFL